MRRRAALAGLTFACLAFAGLFVATDDHTQSNIPLQSYVTQANPTAALPEYDTYFGDNWGSVRVFRLLTQCPPLKIYIDNRSGFKPHYMEYIVWSLSSWSQALNGRLSYQFTNNPAEADITVDWVPRFSDRYIAGLTTFRVGHADIQIKTEGVPEKDIKTNIIHEFGHALGIAGHSENPNDIMVGVRRWRRGTEAENYNPQLSRNDIQAIRRLYSITWQRGEDLYASAAQNAALPMPSTGVMAVRSDGRSANSAVNNLQPMADHID